MKIFKNLLDNWRAKQDALPVPDNVYGRTRERALDAAGVFRVEVWDAHRGPGVPLLPPTGDATWMVLSPYGTPPQWLPLQDATDQMYVDLGQPDFIGILIDGTITEISLEEAKVIAEEIASGKGIGLALAYYDLDGPYCQLFIPDNYMDQLEDDWRFDIEVSVTQSKRQFPWFKDVIETIAERSTIPPRAAT
jgi:hypothetical protein